MQKFKVFSVLLLSINLFAYEYIEFPGKGFYTMDRGDECLNTKHYNQSCGCTIDMHENKNSAKELYKESCMIGNGKGCYKLGFVHDIQGEKSYAKKYYIKACDLGYMSGCKQYRVLENNGVN